MSVNEIRKFTFKTIINKLDFLRKIVIFNETLEKKIFIVAC